MQAGWRLTVASGPRCVPLLDIPAPSGLLEGPWTLSDARGRSRPAQVEGGRLRAVLAEPCPGEQSFSLEPLASTGGATARPAPGGVAMDLDGQTVTRLHLEGTPKPFLHPLLAPGGLSVVRGWPLAPDPGDRRDHPHHRGLWTGHGDLASADTWEEGGRRSGRIVVSDVHSGGGPAAAQVALDLRWETAGGQLAALERRVYTLWAYRERAHVLDVTLSLAPGEAGPLRFGDTKEGGLVALRLAAGLEQDRGGQILTSEGARGEAEAWGSAAAWCACGGAPLGAPDSPLGVAVLSHPDNPVPPMRWHVRAYGLLAANPFALSQYHPGRGEDGSWTAPASGARFRFRVLTFRGRLEELDLAGCARDWGSEPVAAWQGPLAAKEDMGLAF